MQKNKSIHSDTYSDFIKLLVKERKRLKLVQGNVAERLNMTQSDISKIENNERRLDILELKQMLEFYRINENPDLEKQVLRFLGLDKEHID